MWSYHEKLQIKFYFGCGWIIFTEVTPSDLENYSEFEVFSTFLCPATKWSGHIVLPLFVILTCCATTSFPDFFTKHLEILNWFLVYRYLLMLQIEFESCYGSLIFTFVVQELWDFVHWKLTFFTKTQVYFDQSLLNFNMMLHVGPM